MAYPQAPIKIDIYINFPQGFTPSTGIPRVMFSSYLPTSMGKSKPVTYGTAISSPSYGRPTSSSHLLTIASFTGITSFLLPTSMMESSWDHRTNSYVTSSMSYVTSSYITEPEKVGIKLNW
jgi:hypothetical protein